VTGSELTDPLGTREPAAEYLDGTLTDAHYRAGRVRGRPYVMVHQGDRARVVAGDGVWFGDEVVCLPGGNHRGDWVTTFALREMYDLPGAYEGNPWSRGDIVIDAGARVEEGAWIVSGVRVGAGATVLPYSVVTRDVPPGTTVGGSPAAVVDAAADAHPPAAAPVPPGRPWRDRLRSLAARLDPSAVTWSDFPTRIRSYPAEILTLGRASYRPPLIFGPPGGGHHVEIGAYCSMAWDAEILVDPGAWPADDPGSPDRSRRRVVLGHDVWLTRMAKVLGGVTVGTGAIIANGAVVTEDVRPYAIVAGNPAREVGRRFTDDQVDGLLEVAWWDWPEATVRERYAELCSDDIDGFLARHRPGGRRPGRGR
jgi:acetyltransferase-like isoleucine patch superfamily enzyme